MEAKRPRPDISASDAQHFRRVMGQFASGVTVITTLHDNEVRGMTANAFMSGSLEPPLCVVSVAKRARMHGFVSASGRFAVNVLAHDQADAAIHFAGRPNPKLRVDIDWVDGLPVLADASAHMAADVAAAHDCGDHTLFVGHLFHMDADKARQPLLYHEGRFGSLVHTREDAMVPAPEFW